ncbi:DNA-binding protein [Candidatus Pacearchaeota archaeon]|jgi:putative nucleotide binding protein|nr:DNA-binding protein [Candidatus Pacearchaeota archaeon]
MSEREEHALVLDYLPYGYPLSGGKPNPIAQSIGIKTLALLELVPRRGVSLEIKEKVYIGSEKRDKIYYIAGRLPREKLTESAKIQLQEFVEQIVGEQEERFVKFFNEAQAMNTRLHQLELLPGFGRKHTQEVVKAREEKPFTSFDDIKARSAGIPDPKKAIEKRILDELTVRQRFNIFTD